MKFIDLKCSNCGWKLTLINDNLLKCNSCQSEFIIDDEKNITNNYTINNTHQKKAISHLPIIAFFILATLSVTIFFILGVTPKIIGRSPNSISKIDTYSYREKPESEAGIAFTEQIFRKSIDKIQTEELKKIKYLSVKLSEDKSNDVWSVSYSFEVWNNPYNYFETEEVILPYDLTLDILDFTCFSGLTYLNFNNTSNIEGSYNFSLKKLDQLTFYGGYFNQSLDDIMGALPHPKKLKYLKAQIRNDSQLLRLQELTNLENLIVTYLAEEVTPNKLKELDKLTSLTINGYYLKDISWLSNFNNLESLSLFNVSKVSDYSSLHSLTNLENLSINSGDMLKDTSFIKNMPKLKRLTLEDTAIHNIRDIADKETIISLHLSGNNMLNNIEEIASLKNLKTLHFESNSDNIRTADLDSLNHLTEVTISGGFLEIIERSLTIKDLSVRTRSDLDLDNLSKLLELETLTIKNSSNLLNLSSLSYLDNFKKIVLQDSTIDFDSISEQIELMPSIEELSLLDSYLALGRLNQLPFPNLKYLEIDENSYFSVWKDNKYMSSFDYGLTLLPDKINSMTNLETLIIPNSQLNTLDFVDSFSNLRVLDVSNSYITDVEPLNALSNLELLNIYNTPINNLDILSDKVFTIR
ncbi:hypothetical protein I6N95_24755 [Vagococcus sp. BWB3-3]|uniref:Leucine-rich repeat domain-containing protein n=1 Tax=Vagococcus allomyrinae TaxID=2794353 RepID=A0A940PAV9_9ENTE|nr:hypothetical protein [Vagococcus allomyrinae]MBP1044225.1 hypothetical protein [Vagococcus allomyrinae]